MEFLSFDVKNHTLALRRADVPNPGPNDVRIRVAYSGICGTDLHILEVRRRSSGFFNPLIAFRNEKLSFRRLSIVDRMMFGIT